MAKPLTPAPLPLVPVMYPKFALLRSVFGLLKNDVFVTFVGIGANLHLPALVEIDPAGYAGILTELAGTAPDRTAHAANNLL